MPREIRTFISELFYFILVSGSVDRRDTMLIKAIQRKKREHRDKGRNVMHRRDGKINY